MSDGVTPSLSVSAKRSPLQSLLARLGGIVLDAILLLLFLAVGVAILDIIIRVIVTTVGLIRQGPWIPQPEKMVVAGREFWVRDGYVVEWEPGRIVSDFVRLGLAILGSVVAYAIFKMGLVVRRVLLSKFIDASFESFVSKRYLLSREGGGLVNLISVVSVLGVAIGVMALVVVISVMDGFDRTIMDRMMTVFAHVEIHPASANRRFSQGDVDAINQALEGFDEVEAYAPNYIENSMVQYKDASGRNNVTGVRLLGLDLVREEGVTNLAREVQGKRQPDNNEIVIGDVLFDELGMRRLGEELILIGKSVRTAQGMSTKRIPLKVVGIFSSGLHEVDSRFAYTTIETAQRAYVDYDNFTMVRAKVSDPFKVQEFKREFESNTTGVIIRTWDELNKPFFEALKTEKIAMFIILLMIVLVASLNIIGTLIMVVTQKTREIGMLKSMGARDFMILRIFLNHGFFIGTVGTSLGVACGWWTCLFVRDEIQKIFQLPAAIYDLDRLPVEFEPMTVLFIALCSLAICLLAGIYPAYKASRLNPVEALRYF